MTRQLTIFGFGALAIVLAAALSVGLVLAQDGSDGDAAPEESHETGPVDGFFDRLAENLGIDRAALDAAIVESAVGELDEAVAEGLIPAELAERLRQAIESGEGFGFLDGLGHGFGAIRPFGGDHDFGSSIPGVKGELSGEMQERVLGHLDELLESEGLPAEGRARLQEFRDAIASGDLPSFGFEGEGRPFRFEFRGPGPGHHGDEDHEHGGDGHDDDAGPGESTTF